MKKLNIILSIGAALGLSACTSTPINNSFTTQTSPMNIISESSSEALIAQKNLQNTKAKKMQEILINSSNIDHDIITIDYIGEPIALLKSISIHYGYRLIESGQAKNLPIINFNKSPKTATEYLRDIATSVDGIDITLDKQQKTILVVYK